MREYLFTDEEVKTEYAKHEKMMNIDKIIDVKGKTLMYAPDIEDLNHEPDITHMLKGIEQTHNMNFDHNFKIRTCCWTSQYNINICKFR